MDLALLDTLEQQHREAEGLLKKMENAEVAAEQQPLVDALLTAMAEHMKIEERDVYPELRHIDGEMAQEAQIEHDLARKGLRQLADMVGKPGFGAAVAMVQAGIEHHVEEEEQQVFPKMRKELGGAGKTRAGSLSSLETRDELYEKAKEQGIEGRSQMTKDELAKAVR
jgi:iron-sulfur cluster repair protein YtfE (RIC family)